MYSCVKFISNSMHAICWKFLNKYWLDDDDDDDNNGDEPFFFKILYLVLHNHIYIYIILTNLYRYLVYLFVIHIYHTRATTQSAHNLVYFNPIIKFRRCIIANQFTINWVKSFINSITSLITCFFGRPHQSFKQKFFFGNLEMCTAFYTPIQLEPILVLICISVPLGWYTFSWLRKYSI